MRPNSATTAAGGSVAPSPDASVDSDDISRIVFVGGVPMRVDAQEEAGIPLLAGERCADDAELDGWAMYRDIAVLTMHLGTGIFGRVLSLFIEIIGAALVSERALAVMLAAGIVMSPLSAAFMGTVGALCPRMIQSFNIGQTPEMTRRFHDTLLVSAVFAALSYVLCLCAEPLLCSLGVDRQMAREAAYFATWTWLGIPFEVAFIALRELFAAQGRVVEGATAEVCSAVCSACVLFATATYTAGQVPLLQAVVAMVVFGRISRLGMFCLLVGRGWHVAFGYAGVYDGDYITGHLLSPQRWLTLARESIAGSAAMLSEELYVQLVMLCMLWLGPGQLCAAGVALAIATVLSVPGKSAAAGAAVLAGRIPFGLVRTRFVAAAWWVCFGVSVAMAGVAFAALPRAVYLLSASQEMLAAGTAAVLYATLLTLFTGLNSAWATMVHKLFARGPLLCTALTATCVWCISVPITLISRETIDGVWSGFVAGQWVLGPACFALFRHLDLRESARRRAEEDDEEQFESHAI